MRLYKRFGLTAAAMFAAVGLLFLFAPDSVLVFFNRLTDYTGLAQAPVQGTGFYPALAAAYMYLVTLLAFLMYRYPEQNIYPLLLAHGKLASAIISIYLFLTHAPYLIFLINSIIDGFIGMAAIYLMKMRETVA